MKRNGWGKKIGQLFYCYYCPTVKYVFKVDLRNAIFKNRNSIKFFFFKWLKILKVSVATESDPANLNEANEAKTEPATALNRTKLLLTDNRRRTHDLAVKPEPSSTELKVQEVNFGLLNAVHCRKLSCREVWEASGTLRCAKSLRRSLASSHTCSMKSQWPHANSDKPRVASCESRRQRRF